MALHLLGFIINLCRRLGKMKMVSSQGWHTKIFKKTQPARLDSSPRQTSRTPDETHVPEAVGNYQILIDNLENFHPALSLATRAKGGGHHGPLAWAQTGAQ
jgi:hypothetical protein